MRPNLSLSNIASTLAALGGATALIVACGGDAKPAANANEVKSSTPSGSGGQASCASNGSCGAKTGDSEKKPDTAATTAATTPPPATTTPATGTAPADTKPGADPKTAATTATTGTTKPTPPPMKPASGGGGTAKPKGQASCGAGTCAADPKKKM